MADDTLQAALEREHREIDGGIAQFLEKSDDAAPLLRSIEALRRHIYLEEELLFPPLRATGFGVPIMVMIREHGEIWQAMDKAEELLKTHSSVDELLDACDLLLELQEKHNSKEEPIIYPQADKKLSFEAASKLEAYLDSSELPEGWICQALEH